MGKLSGATNTALAWTERIDLNTIHPVCSDLLDAGDPLAGVEFMPVTLIRVDTIRRSWPSLLGSSEQHPRSRADGRRAGPGHAVFWCNAAGLFLELFGPTLRRGMKRGQARTDPIFLWVDIGESGYLQYRLEMRSERNQLITSLDPAEHLWRW